VADLQTVRGTHDLFGDEYLRHKYIADVAMDITSRYGFSPIATPIFEFTNVFSRSIGETTDVVTKEMYSFEDRGGESLTLRPEGTAGVVRAFISNGLQQNTPVKFSYHGPMFRYERPQKGRQRQFHQFGVELLGVAQPQADVEVVAMGADFLEAIGLKDKIELQINTLGDTASRELYKEKLVQYFSKYTNDLSEDSRNRLEKNPLRILDSKEECDKLIVEDAPVLKEYLNDESRKFFDDVLKGLSALGIKYVENDRLVRGLDYYSHTAFEFVTTKLGAQGTVLGGGRYDGLVEQMGGKSTPGIGWACGMERLSMLLEKSPALQRPIVIIPVGPDVQDEAMKIAHDLRRAGFVIEQGYAGNIAKRMKKADKVNACAAIILGSDELSRSVVMLRDLDSGDQQEIALDKLSHALEDYNK